MSIIILFFRAFCGEPMTSSDIKCLGVGSYMVSIIDYLKVSEYGKSLETDISK
jgi:hypothetical protein